MIHTPGLVKSCEDVTLDDLIANIAKISEQLMVVGFTVGKAFSFVVPISQKRLLTFCTHKVLYVPMFPQRCYDSFLNWPPASPTNGYPHLVMTPETVKLIELVGCVSRPGPYFPGAGGELLATPCTIEVVGVVNLSPESQRFSINDGVALLTHVLAQSSSLYLGVTLVAKSSALVLDEP